MYWVYCCTLIASSDFRSWIYRYRPACLSYLAYSHSTPSPLCLCGFWKSTTVWSCRPGCGSDCVHLFLCPGSAPWSRPLLSSSCTGCRTRWRLSLHCRNRLSRGSGRSQWTAGWMKGRCRSDHLRPKVRPRKRKIPNSCSISDNRESGRFHHQLGRFSDNLIAQPQEWCEKREGGKKWCGSMKLLMDRQPKFNNVFAA